MTMVMVVVVVGDRIECNEADVNVNTDAVIGGSV